MIIKNRTAEGWEELYPKTLAENVYLNSGKTLQEEVDLDERTVEIIEREDEISKSKTIVFNNKFFILSATATLSGMTQNKYLRNNIIFPFNNAEVNSISASAILTAASGSLEDTTHVYIREKHANRVQVSTIGSYTSGNTVNVDVQVMGVLT